MADFDEFERAASAFPDLDDIGGTAPTAGRTSFPALDGDDDGFGSFENDDLSFSQPKSQPSVRVTGNDEIDKFEGQFPDIGGAVCLGTRWLRSGADDAYVCRRPMHPHQHHPSHHFINRLPFSNLLTVGPFTRLR